MKKSLLIILLILVACDGDAKLIPKHKILAQINNNILNLDIVESQIPMDLSPEEKMEIKRKIIHRWIDRNLLYLEAMNSGIQLSESHEFQLNEARKEYLIDTYLSSKLSAISDINEKEVTDYYTLHKDEFVNNSDKVHLVHLFLERFDNTINQAIFDTKNLIDVIKQFRLELLTGDQRISGDLGIIELNQLNQEFKTKCQNAKEMDIIGPFKYQNQLHYLQVIQFYPKGQILAIESIKDEIKIRLLTEKREKLKKDLIEKLKSNYIIENNLN